MQRTISSSCVEWDVICFLEKFSRRSVFKDDLLKNFNLAANNAERIKIWAEKHFNFNFCEEDKQKKISTVGDLIRITVKYVC